MGARYDALPAETRAAYGSDLARRRDLGRLTKAQLIDRVLDLHRFSEAVASVYGSESYDDFEARMATKHEVGGHNA